MKLECMSAAWIVPLEYYFRIQSVFNNYLVYAQAFELQFARNSKWLVMLI